jgi:hypothetical protein
VKGINLTAVVKALVVGMVVLVMGATDVFSMDRPFNNPANWGGTGLMEIPNARILEDGVLRFGAAQALPYRWYTASMGVLPGLEISARLTEIKNIPAFGPGSEYGAYKDKALDIKYQLIPESKYLPAIAIGIHDFWGTRLFPSEYLVINRQYYPFDITLGIGSKRLKGGLSVPLLDDYGFFGGIELALSERFLFMAEYNPIDYENDKKSARGVPEGADSPVNVGLRANILPGIDMGISYQRGDTLGLMLHVQSLLGAQVLPQRADPPPLVPVDRRPFEERDQKEIVKQVYDAVQEAGFSDIAVYTDGKDLIAEFENDRYLSNPKAVGRVLRILLFHSPEDTDYLVAVVKKHGMAILRVSVRADHMDKFLLGKISEHVFMDKLMKVEITSRAVESGEGDYIRFTEDNGFQYDFSIKPDLDIYWNDPSGFMKYSAGVDPYVTAELWKGASAYARYAIPLYSNVYSPMGSVLPDDVIKSDISKYMGKYRSFDRLLVNQVFRISDRTFGRISMGYFDKMYAGVGGEALYFPGEGTMAFGIEGDWLRKRVPKKTFELMDFSPYSVLGNAYYYYSGLDMTFQVQFGRFLAGDVGWKFDISRQYDTGAVAGIFVTFTDTDGVEPYFNEGYNHKGIYLSLPMRMFLDHDSTRTLNYGISPWTRDVGLTVAHWQELFSLAKDLMPSRFKAKAEELKD